MIKETRIQRLQEYNANTITPHRGCIVIHRCSKLAGYLRKHCEENKLTGILLHDCGVIIQGAGPAILPAIGEGYLLTLQTKPVRSGQGYRVLRIESDCLRYLGQPCWTVSYSEVRTDFSLVQTMLRL